MNPVHAALRAGTAEAHDRVDGAFASFDLASRDGYATFLKAHAEVLLPMEAALDTAGARRVAPDWDVRKRGDLLIEDLAHLRTPDDRPGRAGLAIAARLDTDAEVAGALYVLEGSRLGGRFLARQLPLGFPRAYLDADQAPENWRNLLDRLETILYQPAELQSALVTANQVFAAFERSAARWARG